MSAVTGSDADVRPPNPPWLPLKTTEPARGCLSFYLSDDLSRLPVRAVTLPANNKSDPNLETQTYGLFSTCERQMRTSVVNRGLRYLLFVTRRDDRRVLTGFYRVAWYCDGVFAGEKPDYALAADRARFMDPVPLPDLPSVVRDVTVRPFRTFRLLEAEHTAALVDLIESQPDRTDDYLAEIDRLERFNRYHTGYRCWQRQVPFTWVAAREYLGPAAQRFAVAKNAANSSPTDYWHCEACHDVVKNKALLKACPLCDALGSLRPMARDELQHRSTV